MIKLKLNDGVEYRIHPVPITNKSVKYYTNLESKTGDSLEALVWLVTKSFEKAGYNEDEIEKIWEEVLLLNSKDEKYGKDITKIVSYITTGTLPEEK